MAGDLIRRAFIGGREYPEKVESVLSGQMQARYGHTCIRNPNDVLMHPDYMPKTINRTTYAIRGAFTLRLIGLEGKTMEEVHEYSASSDVVPQLKLLGNLPVMYRLLGVVNGTNFLKTTKLVRVQNGLVKVTGRGAEMLEDNKHQAYTVLPEELHNLPGQDIGGEYTYRPIGPSRTEIAAMVYEQYLPHYIHLGLVE